MDIIQGMAPAPRALVVLAARPAPLATPAVDEGPPGEPIAVAPAEVWKALGAGVASVPRVSAPQEDLPMWDHAERAILLAFKTLGSQPAGPVGKLLFTAQLAGVLTGIAAAQTDNPELLAFSNRLRTGTGVVGGALSGNYLPSLHAATKALVPMLDAPEDVKAAVLEAASVMASLPPGKPG